MGEAIGRFDPSRNCFHPHLLLGLVDSLVHLWKGRVDHALSLKREKEHTEAMGPLLG